MINKNNKLLVAMLSFVVVCVVGYALFSDNIKVTGSATASGDWAITATCEEGISSSFSSAIQSFVNIDEIIKEGGYGNSSCSVSGNTVTMSTELKYPTAQRAFTIKFKNEGNMDAFLFKVGTKPVKNTSITVYNSDNSIYKELTSSSNEFQGYLNEFGQFSTDGLVIIRTASGSILTEDNWQDRIYEKAGRTSYEDFYLKLQPGETLETVSWAYWDEDATLSNGYRATTTAIITAEFEQKTDDMNIAPNGFTCFAGC